MSPTRVTAHRRVLRGRFGVELRRARLPFAIMLAGVAIAIACAAALISREDVTLPWQSSYIVRIATGDATGVVPGVDEVRWAGVVVGRITAAQLSGDHAVLTAQIAPGKVGDARLYENATVQLRPNTPLQDMYLDVLHRGTASSGVLRPGQVLQAAQTQTPVNIADVLDVFSLPVRTSLQQSLGELATGLTGGDGARLRYAFATLVPMLAAEHRLTTVLAQRQTIVKALVHDSNLLFGVLAQRDARLAQLVTAGATTFRAIGQQRPALAAMLNALPPTLTQMHVSLDHLGTTLGVVRPALRALIPTAHALPTGLRALQRFAAPATPALRALQPALVALTPLAIQLKPTAGALDHALAELQPQIPRLDRITAKVVPCELPVDKFFAWTLSVFKFGDNSDLTSSPRGVLVADASDNGAVKDPLLQPAIGCADGKAPPDDQR